ncbi:YqzM family protein [Gracilibacillus salitolerans]|uniref:YqzM family protein n=1 Tax=Gracilibacillus salitolerans TaxID=2663022 RepID=A0A5Q2TJA1_9BACI|nr:YqzM family protein [Gracilibacillus salitolerans]QGH34989.1 YqzM family protein [Gracilibacillus salitolerans]
MNEFEKDVQSKRHDIFDAGFGFVFSFLFFMIIFFIGVIFDAIAS